MFHERRGQVALHACRSRMPAHQESQEFLVERVQYTSSTTLPTFVFPDNFPANHAGVLRVVDGRTVVLRSSDRGVSSL